MTIHSKAAVALIAGVVGCASPRSRVGAPAPNGTLSQSERVAHVLPRLTFGARTGDAERVAAMGIDRWIDQQLSPEMIPDSAVATALATNPAWNVPASTVASVPPLPRSVSITTMASPRRTAPPLPR